MNEKNEDGVNLVRDGGKLIICIHGFAKKHLQKLCRICAATESHRHKSSIF